MGYLANIIQDARRQSLSGPFLPLPLDEPAQPERGLVDAQTAVVAPPTAQLSSASIPYGAAMRTLPTPVNSVALSVKDTAGVKESETIVSHTVDQGVQAEINHLASPQPQGNESSQKVAINDHGAPRVIIPRHRTEVAEDFRGPAKNAAGRHGEPESAPAMPFKPSSRILTGEATPAQSKNPDSSHLEAGIKVEDSSPVETVPAQILSSPPVERIIFSDEEPGRVSEQRISHAVSFDRGRSRQDNQVPPLSPVDSPTLKNQILPNEKMAWRQEPIAISTPCDKTAEPRVHIGRIEVVILAPEPKHQGAPPASSAAGLVNRQYLRRL